MSNNDNDPALPQNPPAEEADHSTEARDPKADETDRVQAELERIKEQMFRIAAEAENTKKRAAREIADARKYALASFSRELLDVADNLSRALAAVPADAREHASEALGGLISGVELTDKNLHKTLDNHGVRKINPLGEKFNPNLHQAVAQIPSTAPAGEIVEVIQPGYLLGDRTLRAAMVAISSGQAPKPAPQDNKAVQEAPASPGSTIDTTA